MAVVKSQSEIQKIAAAGKILGYTLRSLRAAVKEGVTPLELDALARQLIEDSGGEPAFLNYQPGGATRPYPATICSSVNDVVVHGVPNNKPLKNGDVVSIDCGVRYQGYNADAAFTVIIGKSKPEVRELVSITEEALYRGIRAAKPNATLGDIGYAIERHIARRGFAIMEGLTGHGIGKKLHEDPYVPNEGKKGEGMKLRAGMVFAIEPMASLGSSKIVQLADESYGTKDRSIAAHFEHTIVITETGAKILTE